MSAPEHAPATLGKQAPSALSAKPAGPSNGPSQEPSRKGINAPTVDTASVSAIELHRKRKNKANRDRLVEMIQGFDGLVRKEDDIDIDEDIHAAVKLIKKFVGGAYWEMETTPNPKFWRELYLEADKKLQRYEEFEEVSRRLEDANKVVESQKAELDKLKADFSVVRDQRDFFMKVSQMGDAVHEQQVNKLEDEKFEVQLEADVLEAQVTYLNTDYDIAEALNLESCTRQYRKMVEKLKEKHEVCLMFKDQSWQDDIESREKEMEDKHAAAMAEKQAELDAERASANEIMDGLSTERIVAEGKLSQLQEQLSIDPPELHTLRKEVDEIQDTVAAMQTVILQLKHTDARPELATIMSDLRDISTLR